MKYSPNELKKTINDNKFKFKKKYGQNFIVDENVINKIVDKSQIDLDTLVIEIGPGAGSLTYYLAKRSKQVICYEIDKEIKPILEDNIKEYNNVQVIYEDFLQANVKEDIKKYNYSKLYLVANLPYYITTPIITKIIEDKIPVDKMVFMVQKEVGNRFKANVNSKDYNSLSIYLNYYFDIRKLMDVNRNVFMPIPNVDSIVLEFVKKDKLLTVYDIDLFFKLVRDSFKQKRKTLKNNLKEYDLVIINKVLHNFDYNISFRAEQIPINVFIEIANTLSEAKK